VRKHKKSVLITGGAGFIGSFLCDRFLAEGWSVLCLDNLFTGNKNNIKKHLNNPDFEFIRHDIIDPFLAEVDLILNFACPASPVHYQHNAIKTIKTNVLGTMNMLGLAKRVGARILQASTSEVYGDPEQHPQKESYVGHVNPIGIRSCYDEGKRVAETLCFDYKRECNVDIRVIRIFNTYGPRMSPDDGRVVSNFITQALQGKDLTIYGDGSQTRSFCFVEDLVEGIYRFSQQDQHTGPVNLGNTGEFTVLELANKVIAAINPELKVVHKDLPSDDPKIRQPDISFAKKAIDWTPRITLDEGLERTIPYFRECLA